MSRDPWKRSGWIAMSSLAAVGGAALISLATWWLWEQLAMFAGWVP